MRILLPRASIKIESPLPVAKAVAYRARMHEYHPDRVTHLGEELQKVAHRKAVKIQQAYEQLRK